MYGNQFGNPYTGYPFMGSQNAPQAPFMPNSISTPTQPLTPPSASPAFLQVASTKDFDSVTIQPGRQALIMAQNDPYIAFKSADAMGMVTTNLYRLEPVTADQINGPTPEYVTRQEFQQTVQQIIDSIKTPRAKKEVTE